MTTVNSDSGFWSLVRSGWSVDFSCWLLLQAGFCKDFSEYSDSPSAYLVSCVCGQSTAVTQPSRPVCCPSAQAPLQHWAVAAGAGMLTSQFNCSFADLQRSSLPTTTILCPIFGTVFYSFPGKYTSNLTSKLTHSSKAFRRKMQTSRSKQQSLVADMQSQRIISSLSSRLGYYQFS